MLSWKLHALPARIVMLRSGAEYLEGLRDGRRVYLGGELVRDVTQHPAFRNSAQSFAQLFDRKRSPEYVEKMSFEENGERYPIWFLQPKTKDDLRRRRDGDSNISDWIIRML